VKIFLLLAGGLFTGLGVLGIFLPLLPSTPLFILAALCWARSSRRFHHGLLHNRFFGGHVRNYLEKRGMSGRQKAFSLVTLWGTILASALLFADALWLKLLLLGIALAVTIHLLSLKTLRNDG
jgi:uncharacterized membrane protein YbaN (DUF454 family)